MKNENNALIIKKIEKKIELDTTQEGFWDCQKCYHHQTGPYANAGDVQGCTKYWSDKQNTWFVPA